MTSINKLDKGALSDQGSRSLQEIKRFPSLLQYKMLGPITQLWYKLGSLY